MLFNASLEEHYWAKVIIPESEDDCWGWLSDLNGQGYARIRLRGKRIKMNVFAHRFSWELHFGPIPEGLLVLHSCDNPPCSNPKHLFIGTHKDNADDKVKKRRASGGGPRGCDNPNSKLTEDQIQLIRLDNHLLLRELADKYKTSISVVHRIRNNQSYIR